jgi:hypothetical protein
VDSAAIRFLPNDVPIVHNKTRAGGNRKHAVAEHRIMLGQAAYCRLQVWGKCNSLKQFRRLVEGLQEVGGDLRQGGIVFHNQEFHKPPICRHRTFAKRRAECHTVRRTKEIDMDPEEAGWFQKLRRRAERWSGVKGRMMAGHNAEILGGRGVTGRAAHRRGFWSIEGLETILRTAFTNGMFGVAKGWKMPSEGCGHSPESPTS